ncbi:SNF2 family N-terminal domain-containing protein [Myxozyma melibiosi]|uniref:Chromatin-remodeling ATPase INO80 n=1 Tax=Myxozyma melibiosi TaxID=54550 RepID=A0ABR1EYR4_9ASCO
MADQTPRAAMSISALLNTDDPPPSAPPSRKRPRRVSSPPPSSSQAPSKRRSTRAHRPSLRDPDETESSDDSDSAASIASIASSSSSSSSSSPSSSSSSSAALAHDKDLYLSSLHRRLDLVSAVAARSRLRHSLAFQHHLLSRLHSATSRGRAQAHSFFHDEAMALVLRDEAEADRERKRNLRRAQKQRRKAAASAATSSSAAAIASSDRSKKHRAAAALDEHASASAKNGAKPRSKAAIAAARRRQQAKALASKRALDDPDAADNDEDDEDEEDDEEDDDIEDIDLNGAGEDEDEDEDDEDEDDEEDDETAKKEKSATNGSRIKLTISSKPPSSRRKGHKSKDDSTTEKSKQKSSKADSTPAMPSAREVKMYQKSYTTMYDTIWRDIARKDIPRVARIVSSSVSIKQNNARKTAQLAVKEARRWQFRTNKNVKDLQAKARRAMREMLVYWKRNEREERDLRRRAEKEALDKAKKEEEAREARRQARKLNFLITQTELYSHFIGRKIKTDEIEAESASDDAVSKPASSTPSRSDEAAPELIKDAQKRDISELDFDAAADEDLRQAALHNAHSAVVSAQNRAKTFDAGKTAAAVDTDVDADTGEMNFQNPTTFGNLEIEQPKLLSCALKGYQLKGLNWLVNLYEQGINGILADEMGLGKTVQSISVMAYLAEVHNIWGPFLVIAPASTLHNWQQEISKFVPDFKALPYWGNAKDRKVLRKFWDRKQLTYTRDAPFHVLVTSYQLIVADAQYFQRIKWQYMILDEAQAIKSSSSTRWKSLLGFQCRNRLLLTGTPIQNSMQELWALLHFIMPTLFDSHDEFSEWFSKDIESHATSNTQLNEEQLKRLHMILKPFMLRRVKKHVQSELGDKIEIDVFCDLTYRQREMYRALKAQIKIDDLMDQAEALDDSQNGASSSNNNSTSTQNLMNLVMQFRKVCNHPDLFERSDTRSPLALSRFARTGSFLREGNVLDVQYCIHNLVEYVLPRLVYHDGLDYVVGRNGRAGFRGRYLDHLFNIWEADYIHENEDLNKAFSWLKFVDASANDVARAFHSDIVTRSISEHEKPPFVWHSLEYDSSTTAAAAASYDPAHRMLLITSTNSTKPLLQMTTTNHMLGLAEISHKYTRDKKMHRLPPMYDPHVVAPPTEVLCPGDRGFANAWHDVLFCRPLAEVMFPRSAHGEIELFNAGAKMPPGELLPEPSSEVVGFSPIRVPPMSKFVTDSGKLLKLDSLLTELKANDHRVLIYFQMTRMMDLMEEFLSYRQYKYVRLDGSSKLSDRRDLVNDWQTKPELFVFLLSTRAGGLGINLTAADTVIFYDSDWNPTIDSQAMDRAHRLGQTKQVTVYRLLVRGTIEERMRDRAKQKMHVQQVVMEGGASAGENAAAAASLNSGGKGEKVVAKEMAAGEEAGERGEVSYWARG